MGNQTSLKTFQRGGCNSLNPPPPPPPASASVFQGLTYNDNTLQFEIKNVLYFIFNFVLIASGSIVFPLPLKTGTSAHTL